MISHTLNMNAAAVIAAASKAAAPAAPKNPGACQQCQRVGVAVITVTGLCAQCSPNVFTRIAAQ